MKEEERRKKGEGKREKDEAGMLFE